MKRYLREKNQLKHSNWFFSLKYLFILREKNQLKHSNFFVWLINIKSRKKTQVTKLDLEIFPIFSYYFLEKIKPNDLTSSKQKKFCPTLNCILFFVFASEITGCLSVVAFISSLGFHKGITSNTIVIKDFVITAG